MCACMSSFLARSLAGWLACLLPTISTRQPRVQVGACCRSNGPPWRCSPKHRQRQTNNDAHTHARTHARTTNRRVGWPALPRAVLRPTTATSTPNATTAKDATARHNTVCVSVCLCLCVCVCARYTLPGEHWSNTGQVPQGELVSRLKWACHHTNVRIWVVCGLVGCRHALQVGAGACAYLPRGEQ